MKSTVMDAVRDNPGIHFRGLQREAGCAASTVDYHVTTTAQLRDREIRGYRRIYPAEVPERFENPLAALNHEPRGALLYLIHREDVAGFSTLHGRMGQSKATISHHLNILHDADLIAVEEVGRRKRYRNRPIVSNTITDHRPSILDRLAGNFISVWDEL